MPDVGLVMRPILSSSERRAWPQGVTTVGIRVAARVARFGIMDFGPSRILNVSLCVC
jgi:hypothetical protein